MTAEDVDHAILKPMVRLYPPPRHLRREDGALDEALGTYRRVLARFDRRVLEAAWDRVVGRNELWCWPKPADVVQAAESIQAVGRASKNDEDWVAQAEESAVKYTRRYLLTSQVAVRAREAGYEASLSEYVREAAWVQAQYIAGRSNVSFSARVLFGPQSRREEWDGFFEKARAQARTGQIRVHVPAAKIQSWKAAAQGEGRSR